MHRVTVNVHLSRPFTGRIDHLPIEVVGLLIRYLPERYQDYARISIKDVVDIDEEQKQRVKLAGWTESHGYFSLWIGFTQPDNTLYSTEALYSFAINGSPEARKLLIERVLTQNSQSNCNSWKVYGFMAHSDVLKFDSNLGRSNDFVREAMVADNLENVKWHLRRFNLDWTGRGNVNWGKNRIHRYIALAAREGAINCFKALLATPGLKTQHCGKEWCSSALDHLFHIISISQLQAIAKPLRWYYGDRQIGRAIGERYELVAPLLEAGWINDSLDRRKLSPHVQLVMHFWITSIKDGLTTGR